MENICDSVSIVSRPCSHDPLTTHPSPSVSLRPLREGRVVLVSPSGCLIVPGKRSQSRWTDRPLPLLSVLLTGSEEGRIYD